jgi:hypothetical protein
MSAAPLPPKALHHRSSADSAKIVGAIPAPVGQPSEGYDQDDYYPQNNWARIRLATDIICYGP